MKEPYYMIDFNAAACLFEIRVNDQPVLTMNLEGQASTRVPVNYAIHQNGKQEVSIKILPLLGKTNLSPKAELSYTVKLYNTVNGFELINEYNGFESEEIEDKVIPMISNSTFFDAEVPYKLRDYWIEGIDIKKIKDYDEKLRNAYRKIINIIKEENYDAFAKKIADREYNMSTSMYLSTKEANSRIRSIINDFKNGYDHVIFEEDSVTIISAYGKKAALKKSNGEPALAFGNKEKQEQLMLDIEFYFNKETNAFEII